LADALPDHGNWYVFAWNAAKERVATFALSRFRQIEPTGARFAPPTDLDPNAYAKNRVIDHDRDD
jgi:predicted DNA-binding transcriptional regulator YafY